MAEAYGARLAVLQRWPGVRVLIIRGTSTRSVPTAMRFSTSFLVPVLGSLTRLFSGGRYMDENVKAVIWLRVSDPGQHTDNQRPALEAFAERRGLDVVRTYTVTESAWRGAHQRHLSEVYNDARAGRFQFLLVWSLDRLSREGVGPTLEIVNRLGKSGVEVWSLQEPWLETSGELRDLLLAMVGWVAKYESNRRSERTKAGLERARANGATLGRPVGSKDTKRRRRSGYFQRYAT